MPDAGRAVAVLAQYPEAYGRTVPRWVLRLMSLFMPVLRENDEMMYQFEHDYRFDSSKIEAAYGLAATPYREGIIAALEAGGREG